jgi:hypothetical protein
MSARMTAQLVTDALTMAIWRRGNPEAWLHHSDRGSQYTSEQFQRLLADHGITCSMSRSGNVWDNAVMESFFSTLKTERTTRRTYRTRDEARADVFDYVERFYNPRRRHSTLGYLSPVEFEMQAASAGDTRHSAISPRWSSKCRRRQLRMVSTKPAAGQCGGVIYALPQGRRHPGRVRKSAQPCRGKGHLSAPSPMGRRACVMLAGAHSGREGRAARDAIYVIYVGTDIYAL